MGSLKLFEAARRAGAKRVVFSSSSSVYGETPELPKREDHTPRPLSPYAVGKLAAEHLAAIYSKSFGLEVVCLRYFNVFGPRQDPNSDYAAVVPKFMRAAFDGKPPKIYGSGEQTRDFTYVSDTVAANLRASQAQGVAGEVFNIAGGRQTSVNTLAEKIATISHSKTRPDYAPARPGDILHSHAAVLKARDILGWSTQVSLEEGLKQTWEWFSAQWQRRV